MLEGLTGKHRQAHALGGGFRFGGRAEGFRDTELHPRRVATVALCPLGIAPLLTVDSVCSLAHSSVVSNCASPESEQRFSAHDVEPIWCASTT